MKLARYGSRLLAVWCALCSVGFFGTAVWLEAKLSRHTPYEPPAELITTLKTTDNIEALRVVAIKAIEGRASDTNYMQFTLPTRAFISLALSAAGAFMLTAALAWAIKREKEESQ